MLRLVIVKNFQSCSYENLVIFIQSCELATKICRLKDLEKMPVIARYSVCLLGGQNHVIVTPKNDKQKETRKMTKKRQREDGKIVVCVSKCVCVCVCV